MPLDYSWLPFPSYQSNWVVNSFFLHNTFLVVFIIFTALLALIFLNRKTLAKSLAFKDKRVLLLLALIFLAGFCLRNFSYSNGIPTDGWVFAESAKHIVKDGLFVKDCAAGNLESCALYEQVLFPPGYPFLIALTYFAFGVNSIHASVVSAMLSALTIPLIFFICRELFKKEEIGLFAALVFAFFPLDLIFASTGNSRPASIFFIALTLFFYLVSLKKNNGKMWALTALAFSYSIYIRQENVVLLAPMILGAFLFDYFENATPKKISAPEKMRVLAEKFLPASCIFFLSQLPVQVWVLLASPLGPQRLFGSGAASERAFKIASDLFFSNPYSADFGYGALFNPLASILFIASPFLLFKKWKRKESLFVWSVLVTFLAIALLYAPHIKNSLDYVRYIHPLALPVSILCGVAIFEFLEIAGKKKKAVLAVFLAAIILFSGIPLHASLFKDARLEQPKSVAFYLEAVQRTPNGCTVIGSNYLAITSDAIPGNKRRTLNPWTFSESSSGIYRQELKEAECLVLLKDRQLKENAPEFLTELKEYRKELLFSIESQGGKIEAFRLEKSGLQG